MLTTLFSRGKERSCKHTVSYNEDTEEKEEASSSIHERVGRGGGKQKD
jgi:hypothetical protein